MGNKFDEMREAVWEAEAQLRAADVVADQMARILIGRLHRVSNESTLRALKLELKDYNITDRTWKK